MDCATKLHLHSEERSSSSARRALRVNVVTPKDQQGGGPRAFSRCNRKRPLRGVTERDSALVVKIPLRE